MKRVYIRKNRRDGKLRGTDQRYLFREKHENTENELRVRPCKMDYILDETAGNELPQALIVSRVEL